MGSDHADSPVHSPSSLHQSPLHLVVTLPSVLLCLITTSPCTCLIAICKPVARYNYCTPTTSKAASCFYREAEHSNPKTCGKWTQNTLKSLTERDDPMSEAENLHLTSRDKPQSKCWHDQMYRKHK